MAGGDMTTSIIPRNTSPAAKRDLRRDARNNRRLITNPETGFQSRNTRLQADRAVAPVPAYIFRRRVRRGWTVGDALSADVPDYPATLLGLINWWRADTLKGLANGTAVGAAATPWRDIIAGNLATQGTGSLQPTFQANVFGSRPAVVFNQNNTTNQHLIFAAPISLQGDFTVVAVIKHEAISGGTTGTWLSLMDASFTGISYGHLNANYTPNLTTSTGSSNFASWGSATLAPRFTVHAVSTSRNGTTATARHNNVRTSTITKDGFLQSDRFGTPQVPAVNFNVYAAEILVYARALTQMEFDQLFTGYLKPLYGI